MSPDALERLLDEFPGLIILDEAYIDYSGCSYLARSRSQENLIILRTFSKAFALAGLRLGYLAGHEDTVRELEKTFQPYSVGLFTQLAGVVALEFQDVMRQRVDETRAQRERLRAAFSQISGVEVFPTATNFLLIRIEKHHQAALQAFADDNVVVRDVSKLEGLEDGIRITVGTPEENDRVVACLRGACG
jgi:histidinol-phosphate aminotransferase